MSIGIKNFENLRNLYSHGIISRGYLLSYFHEDDKDFLDKIAKESRPFIPKIEKPEIKCIENRFEILDL